ncbi:glycosyltransferase [Phaeacidiphilus oryzae]|uniref:glycosyltransferase n=1 Tax=Phaeacidiphilus oryzae TaxID=348818 RepID=UPI00055BD425|nr:glycosyltransferase [Phaeacidiphilus oryzae]
MTPRSGPRGGPRPRDVFLVVNAADELGGATAWAHTMAGLLAGRGHRVRLVGIAPAAPELRRPPSPSGPPPGYQVLTLHPRHPGTPWTPRRPLVAALLHPRRALGALRRRQRRDAAVRRFDRLLAGAEPGGVVVNVQIWAMGWTSRTRRRGLHTIGMSHESYQATADSSRHARVLSGYARSQVDRMLVLTREDADAWITETGMNHVGAVPNPLPFPPPEERFRSSAKVVSAIGRIAPEKGLDQLLDAWSELHESFPGWELRIHGSGSAAYTEELRRRAKALRITSSVTFAGGTGDVPGVLAGTAVLALPSRAEGFPLTLLEAMSCGVPCVAFDVAPGIREIIEDGVDGLLAPPGDLPAFTDALRRLMAGRELRDRLGDKAFHSIRRYSPDAVLDQWERLFELLDR